MIIIIDWIWIRMCQQITCSICKKITWSGCGKHIEATLAGVPSDRRCRCRDNKSSSSSSGISKNTDCADGICVNPNATTKKPTKK